MRYEFTKMFFKELIISERKQTADGKELDVAILKFFKTTAPINTHKFRILDMKETGEVKKLFHHHIIIWWESGSVIKPTTFRSQIQKFFGKSNTVFDWKYRAVRTDLTKFLLYIMKDGLVSFNKNFPQDVITKYRGKYQKQEYNVDSWLDELRQHLTRCKQCIQWEKKYCKRDCIVAVRNWYKIKKKRFDLYRMKNDACTLYYWDNNNEEDFIQSILDKM